MMIKFTKYRKIYFGFSLVLVLASFFLLFGFGLKPGIDFTGGTIMELEYKESRISNEEIRLLLEGLDLGTLYIQPTGEKGVILRMRDIDEDAHQNILARLRGEEEVTTDEGLIMETIKIFVEETRFESIGPTIGQELKSKTSIVIIVSLFLMIVYISLAFRRVRRPIRSWQYGIASVIALFHDILIPLAVFAVLGKYYGIEVTIPVVTALLAILGYSINNTVVVFDRIRENLLKRGGIFDEIVDISLIQTLSRQINTSLTTLFVALAIFLFGGATLQYFALALILGIIAGTYSSIFLAGPILVSWYSFRNRRGS